MATAFASCKQQRSVAKGEELTMRAMKILRHPFVLALVLSVLLVSGGSFKATTLPDTSQETEYVEILVQFKSNADASGVAAVHDRNGGILVDTIKEVGVQVIQVPAAQLANTLASYANDALVEYAEPNYPVYVLDFPEDSPNDPHLYMQWGMDRIKAPQAWGVTTGNSDIRIAILDSGIDQDHPDLPLGSKIVANQNFSSSDTWDDLTCHGTHVAGIAAAATNNGIGVAGVGCDSSLMNVKVMGDTGSGTTFAISQGIYWATNGPDGDPETDDGAHVINMSLGTLVPSSTLERAVTYAWEHGVVLIAAAGNHGSTSPGYPARYPDCIAVAGTRTFPWNPLMPSSAYGDWVDVAAPGESIWSTYNNGGYGNGAGTSQASPHVAGLAALLFTTVTDVNGNGFVNDEVRYAIESGCSDEGIDVKYGFINAYDAVTATIPSLGFISGVVTDSEGAAVFPTYGCSVKADTWEAFTKSDGSYTIYGVPAGEYDVTVSALGYTEDSQSITVTAGETTEVNFTLDFSPPGSITGVVKNFFDPDELIEGATVTDGTREATSNADGEYTIENVPAGDYDLTARAPGYMSSVKPAIVQSNEECTVNFNLWPASNNPPNQPTNDAPSDGATEIAVTATLESSNFDDPDGGAVHVASQWQVTTTPGSYSTPVFDSGTDNLNLVEITMLPGTLSYDTTYYWHVRHQDQHEDWSEWSVETSFTTETEPSGTEPTVSIDDIPDFVSSLTSVSGTASGTASAELDKVQVAFRIEGGNYWNGSDWTGASATWFDASGTTTWSYDTCTTEHLNGVWGSSSDDVFAVGDSGTILRYNGSAWMSMYSNTTSDLNGVWGSSASDVFAVGAGGTIVHWDNSTWSPMTSNTTQTLYGVWGSPSSDDVYAVGEFGVIVHYNGDTWTETIITTISRFNGVWGSSASDVFAVGEPKVGETDNLRHYDGGSWTPVDCGTTNRLYGVWGSPASDVFVVGESGTIRHWDDSTWSPMTSGVPGKLHGVWGSSASDDVYAVGELGAIVHYDGDGSTWDVMTSDTTSRLNGVWGSSASDVFAVGAGATILHYSSAWSPMSNGIPFADGTQYTVYAKAIDVDANESSPDSESFTFDTTDPVVTVTSPNGGEFWAGESSQVITWTATDNNMAASPITIEYFNGATWVQIATSQANDEPYTWATVPSLDISNARVRVTADDEAGNSASDESNASFTIDSTDPVVTVTSPNGGEFWAGGSSQDITWTATDDNMAASPITIEYWDGDSWEGIATGEANDGTYAWATVPSLNISTARVRVTADDKAGNSASDESSADFTIDSTDPTVTITTDIPPFTSSLASVSGTASDSLPGELDKVQVAFCIVGGNYWNGSNWGGADPVWLDAPGTNEWTCDSSGVPFADGTEYRVYAKSTDKAGNESVLDSDSFIFDTTAPVVTVTSPDGGEFWAGGSSQFITWTATDDNMAADPITIEYFNGATWVEIATGEANDETYTWEPVPSLDISTARVRVTAEDKAGNTASDESEADFTIDSTDPTVAIDDIDDVVDSLDSVSGTASDGELDKVQVAFRIAGGNYWDGSNWETATDPVWFDASGTSEWTYDSSGVSFTSGTQYTVSAKCTDRAGNESTVASDSFTMVTTIPTVSIDDFPDVVTSLASVSGTASAVEPAVLDKVQVAFRIVDGDYWTGDDWSGASPVWLDASGTTDWSYDSTEIPFADGMYTVSAKSIDNAAIESSVVSRSFTIDSTSPSVTVTSPDGGEFWAGGSSQVITWTASDDNMAASPITIEYWDGDSWEGIATGEDNDGTYTWEPVPSLDISTARVRVTAEDKAGNSASDESNANFTIDSTDPAVFVNDIPDFVPSLASVSGTASDTSPGQLEEVWVQINNTTDSAYWDGTFWVVGESWLEADGTTDWTYVMPSLSTGKAYVVKAKSIDKSGHLSTVASSGVFIFDTTNPAISINNIPDFVPSLASISGSASDISPGELEKVQVQINNTNDSTYWNGSSWIGEATWLDVTVASPWTYAMPSLTDGKAYTVKARSVDKAGNESTVASDSFIFDATNPTVSVNDIRDFYDPPESVSGTASDASPGELEKIKVAFSLKDGNYWTGSDWSGTGPTWFDASGTSNWTYNSSGISFAHETEYTVYARSIDKAGNESSLGSDDFITAPLLEPMGNGDGDTDGDGDKNGEAGGCGCASVQGDISTSELLIGWVAFGLCWGTGYYLVRRTGRCKRR